MKKEIAEFNVLRAAAIIIILIHHLPNFTINFFNLNNFGIPIDVSFIIDLLRYFGLGIFIFISGFLLEFNDKKMSGLTDAVGFLIKRYVRILPLYLIAYILFIFIFRNTIEHLNIFSITAHVLGLQILLSSKYCDTVVTLWYIGLIISYYFVFVLISLYGKSKIKLLGILSLIAILWLCGKMILGIGDQRFILYLPVFIFGILSARTDILKYVGFKSFLVAFCLLIFCAGVYTAFVYPQTALFIPIKPNLFSAISFAGILILNIIMALTVIITYFLSKTLAPVKNSKLIRLISYSSFCIYLFHRPFITVLLRIYHPEDPMLKLLYVVVCGFPLVFIAGYFIQKQYDSFIVPALSRWFK